MDAASSFESGGRFSFLGTWFGFPSQPTGHSVALLREAVLKLRHDCGVTIAGGAELEAARARARVLDSHR